MSGDHNQYQKPDYVDRQQWKYDPMTGEPLIDGWPLYSGLPKREWVGLTDEEIKEIVGPWGGEPIKGYTRELIDKIESKLKEKNG